MFWSEIGSGFGEPGGTPLPRISRNPPPPGWKYLPSGLGGRNTGNVLNKMAYLASKVYCLFSVCFFSPDFSHVPTRNRKTRRHSPARKAPSEKRKLLAQNDRAATDRTRNSSTNSAAGAKRHFTFYDPRSQDGK